MAKTDQRILVVDDDEAMLALLQRYLSEHGYVVRTVADGPTMEAALAAEPFELVVLDLMLPGEDGLSLAKRIRARGNLPIIMISACGADVDRIVGLEVGADDYLPKPFNPRELLARIRAVLRRSASGEAVSGRRDTFGPFVLDHEARRLLRDGREVRLTGGEFALLSVLVGHPNRVLSRDNLLQLLKGYDHQPFDRSIDVSVARLRRRIENDPASPCFIRTVWGEGYLFNPQGGAG